MSLNSDLALKLISDYQLQNKLFDKYRIVDIERNQVCSLSKEGEIQQEGFYCYDTWNQKEPCNHCIAFRAFREKKRVVKLEHGPKSVFLVMAIPLPQLGGQYVLEAITDVSDGYLMSNDLPVPVRPVTSLLNQLNHLSLHLCLPQLYSLNEISEHITDLTQQEEPLYCLAISIDGLTAINQLRGYPAGDLVMLKLAQLIQEAFQPVKHRSARLSGNQFLIFYSGGRFDDEVARCQTLQQDVARSRISHEKITLSFTVSMGLHAFDKQLDDEESLASRSLYLMESGKRTGSNTFFY